MERGRKSRTGSQDPHHAEDFRRDEDEGDKQQPDEGLGSGFDGLARHGGGTRGK